MISIKGHKRPAYCGSIYESEDRNIYAVKNFFDRKIENYYSMQLTLSMSCDMIWQVMEAGALTER